MKGVQYVIDDRCQVQAVIIDLKNSGTFWEDIQDILISRGRRKDRRYSLAQVEARLRKRRKIS
jgi:hypothetical protein